MIETLEVYKRIENLCLEKGIPFCHYEKPESVNDFNRSPKVKVCLIKTMSLLNINLASHKDNENEIMGGESVHPGQYQCIASANNIVFPDAEWTNGIKKREEGLK